MQTIVENNSRIKIEPPQKDVHKKMKVFYNQVMESNRNITILLLNALENQYLNLADPLAGSGIRSIRFMKELTAGKINHLFVNDQKELFKTYFNQTLRLNQLSKKNFSIFNEEASLFLLNRVNDKNKPEHFCGYFDYIEIDPFGSPNPFLSAAIARIARTGILAITATDLAALTGTYPASAKRKYWSTITKNQMMHESGLRILIRKVQLLGMQFDKALFPVLAYYKDHYFRIYFRSLKGKEKCDEIAKQHLYLLNNKNTLEFEISSHNYKKDFTAIGPLWAGKLFDKALLRRMIEINVFNQEKKFLDLLSQEKDAVGFHDLHELSRKYQFETPKIELALKKLNGTRTHFSPTGIKTNKKVQEIIKIIRSYQKNLTGY